MKARLVETSLNLRKITHLALRLFTETNSKVSQKPKLAVQLLEPIVKNYEEDIYLNGVKKSQNIFCGF